MNLKTTLALLVLGAACAGLLWSRGKLPARLDPDPKPAPVADSPARDAILNIDAKKLRAIEIHRGDQKIVLTRTPGGDWVMPGNWPTKTPEVKQLIERLTNLESRFEPLPGGKDDLKKYGLDKPAVTVSLRTNERKYTLAFADAPLGVDADRFDRPTYVRLDDGSEVYRLRPGLVAALDKPADYYQRRRLFPSKRVPRQEGDSQKVDRLTGASITVDSPGVPSFTLAGKEYGWELAKPVRDALDPRLGDALLDAVPDIWAERFVPADVSAQAMGFSQLLFPSNNSAEAATTAFIASKWALSERGLLDPERTLTVTRGDGSSITLYVGKPTLDVRNRDRSFACLKNSDLVFEIRTNKFKDIFVPVEMLRDSQLAHFKPEDVRKIHLKIAGNIVELTGEKSADSLGDRKWRLRQPIQGNADSALVRDLLSKLSTLTAVDKDAAEKFRASMVAAGASLLAARPAGWTGAIWLLEQPRGFDPLGLARPEAVLTLSVEEEIKKSGDEKKTKKRTHTFRLGKRDKDSKKLYVQVDDWPRVNEVDDSVADLVLGKRPIDFRGKRLFDFSPGALQEVRITQRIGPGFAASAVGLLAWPPAVGSRGIILAELASEPSAAFVLHNDKGGWKLTGPATFIADLAVVDNLVGRLSRLEVLGFVDDQASRDDENRKYGLGFPGLIVELHRKNAKPLKLLVGRARSGQSGYFAKEEGRPEIFALPADIFKLLSRDSLAYRPLELWKLTPKEQIQSLQIRKEGQTPYYLTRKGEGWEVTGPFTVQAPRAEIDKLAGALRMPRAEAYRSHSSANLQAFGLAKPEITLTVTTRDNKKHTLLLGSLTANGRFAKLADAPGILEVGDPLVQAAERSPLDFLDRTLLKFDPMNATLLRRQSGEDLLELAKKDEGWVLTKPAEEPGDEKKVIDLMRLLANLQASRIAAYPAKDLKSFGLDKPSASITLQVDEGEKPANHVIRLGKEANPGTGNRFAQVDDGKAIAVLPEAAVKALLGGPLVYRDHGLVRFADADKMQVEFGKRKVTFTKVEGTWKLTEPLTAEADDAALEGLLNVLAKLSADELVAAKPNPDSLKKLGLDKPQARWRMFSGEKEVLNLLIGAAENGGKRRYGRLAGKDLIFLLDPKVSESLLTEYRPRSVWKNPIDAAQVESIKFGYPGAKAFELKKVDDNWEVAGKPALEVRTPAVNQTLAALRALKLERYAVDKGADLSLFGLKPPELALEVTTPTGKHTIYLGGLEDGSKRRYAHMPETGATAVFLLSEADSDKLFRGLAAFTKK
jgi:hypothetical protein